MNNLWTKLTNWFKSKSAQTKEQPKPIIQPVRVTKPFKAKHYKKLIKKLTNQARIIQKRRRNHD